MNRVHSIFSKEQVKLLGYVNRLREFPSAAIGIFQRGDKFFAIWPSTEITLLTDMTNGDDLRAVHNYHPLTREYLINPGTQLVFAMNEQELLIGTITEVKQQIDLRLRQSGISEQEESILREYLIIDS